MSIELGMPSSHLILCRPLLLPPSIFPNIRCTLVYNTWFFLHLRYVRYYPEVKDKNPTWCNRHFDKMWNQWLNINRHPEYSIPLPTPLPPLPSPLQYLSLLFVRAKSLQSCLTLCDPMDCSPPGSSVHGIFQARILEWVAISFSRRSSWPRDWTWVSRVLGRRFTIWATTEDRFNKSYL